VKVSYRWIRDLAPGIDFGPEEVGERLASRGAPVEEWTEPGRGLEAIRVGRVREIQDHPNADRLLLCEVDVGEGTRRVVCGAPNVREGGAYPFAPPGTRLPGGLEVGRAEIRGVVSEGMLCSERELGLGSDRSGLLEVSGDLPPGASFVEVGGLDDVLLDVEVTPNRGDLLSHLGVARELAPGGEGGLRLPAIPGAVDLEFEWRRGRARAEGTWGSVRIEDPDLCARYLGAVVRGVEIGPSPPWLASRIRAAGARPINNVVDATNYVLLEMGQPLHAFDLKRLGGAEVVVRRARKGETITTLDGVERTLREGMLAICDAEVPVAVAGVMGGEDSEVSEKTTGILLECALFDPPSVRATRSALELSTEASYRFERGVDPEGMEAALRRAVEVIRATAEGEGTVEVLDAHPRPADELSVHLRLSRIGQVLGVSFGEEEVRELLEPLGFVVSGEKATPRGVLSVRIPGWRSYDVRREIDLIEEVARIYGYDRFPDRMGPFRPGTVPDDPLFRLEDALRDHLVARGFFEAQVPAFAPADEGEVALSNPISAEESHLRTSLVPGLVRRVEHNFARGVRDVRLFEIGTCFFRNGGEEGRPREETRLAVVATGRRHPPHWSRKDEPFDLFDLKALLEDVALRSQGPGATVRPVKDSPWIFRVQHPEDPDVGGGGAIPDEEVDAPPWAGRLWALELTLPEEAKKREERRYEPPPAFPGAERDLALLVPDTLAVARVIRAIEESGGPHLASSTLFDLYEGEEIPEGLRSVGVRLRFVSRERTLKDEEVDEAMGGVVRRLEEELGVEPRRE